MKPKIYICGSVAARGEEENIAKLVKIFDYFYGACFSVNYDKIDDCNINNPTYFLLDKYKKEGKILLTPWVNINAIPMTIALQCGKIKHGSWVVLVDAQELIKESFLKDLPNKIAEWEKKEIYSVWWGKPYIFKFFEWQTFVPNSTHCMVSPLYGKTLSIQDESKVLYDYEKQYVHFGHFLINKKKFANSMLLHGIKYSLLAVTNQFKMYYPNPVDFQMHEIARRSFCQLLESKNYDRTLEGLEKFFRNKENLTSDVQNYLAIEWVFADFFKYKILNYSLDEVLKTRHTYILSEKDFK